MIRPVVFLLSAAILAGCSATVDGNVAPTRLPIAEPAKDGGHGLARKAGQRVDRHDDHAALREISRPLAVIGDPEIHYRLALGYATGQGASRNDAAAAHWYRLAAGEGHTAASYRLGLSYAEGRGVPRNKALAALWYWQAALQGYAPAQYQLGLEFSTGSGVPRNDAVAARWFRSAAKQGQVQAQAAIGVMYVSGQGVSRDPVRGYMWLSLAAHAGDASAGAAMKIIRLDMTAAQIAEADRLAAEWRLARPR